MLSLDVCIISDNIFFYLKFFREIYILLCYFQLLKCLFDDLFLLLIILLY
nr:MAG TPA: hypothetical protein [Caudoviricetes sp.]